MASSSSNNRDNSRVHLRLPLKLKRQVEAFAKKNHTTVTATVIRAVVKLLREEERVGIS
jgi:hypothetical protein